MHNMQQNLTATLTPSPITVASEQCVIVGVTSTLTVEILDWGLEGGKIAISGRETTASDPKERGCSGSEIVLIRSKISCSSISSRSSRSSERVEGEEGGDREVVRWS